MFEKALKQCSKTANHREWGLRHLEGRGAREAGLLEMRFFAENKAYRVLLVFHGRRRCVLLVGCSHKDKVYKPANAIKTAVRRAQEVKQNAAPLREREIAEDY